MKCKNCRFDARGGTHCTDRRFVVYRKYEFDTSGSIVGCGMGKSPKMMDGPKSKRGLEL